MAKEKKKLPRVTLIIRNAANMSNTTKKNIAKWIRNKAVEFEFEAEKYSKRFTARYY